jgi:hypothetical protein
MKLIRWASSVLILLAGLVLCQRGPVQAQASSPDDHGHMDIEAIAGAAGDPAEVQIARAMAAGPQYITGSARIIGADAHGNRTVLRQGSNGFTCQPGNHAVAGRPASCWNEAARQWNADLAAHKATPTNTEPGIVYMLGAGPARSAADSSGKTATAGMTGPQWMILWPFDPKTTGLSATPKDTGAYIMNVGTPYVHLHLVGHPVGAPAEHVAAGLQEEGGTATVEPADVQMARAIAAGPKEITDQARIMGTDAQGNRIVLREGNNDFICQPGKPQFVAQPASCYSLNSKPRITYMLAGATQRSISDRDDKTSTPLAIGPHWMIMMPFDPETTGLPVTYSDTGVYIMWARTPSAHLHIMGRP